MEVVQLLVLTMRCKMNYNTITANACEFLEHPHLEHRNTTRRSKGLMIKGDSFIVTNQSYHDFWHFSHTNFCMHSHLDSR